jgi:hypothetical protein
VPRFNVDGLSSIAADPAVVPERVAQDSAPGRPRMDLRVRAGPCTQRGPSRVDPPGPVDGLASVPLGLASALGLASVPLGQDPVVPPG